jgi:hypothetical protein
MTTVLTPYQSLEFKQMIRLIHHGLQMRLENEDNYCESHAKSLKFII